MIGKKKDKCFSPWFGYLVILAVCAIIASAIFFESKGNRRKRRGNVKQVPHAAAMQAAFPSTPGTTDEKLAF